MWLLGEGRSMEPSQFKRDCIMKGMDELNKQEDLEASLKIIKKGRKVVGYEMTIVSDRGNNKKVIEGNVIEKVQLSAPASDLDQFFDNFKKTTGVSVTKLQKARTIKLAEAFNTDERLQVLNFGQKLFVDHGGEKYAYLLQIVANWKEAGLKTLAEVKAFYKKGKVEKSGKAESTKPNVPEWSNPDYVNTTTEQEKAELEAKKQELLNHLNK